MTLAKQRLSKPKGFTLLEIMVTMAIVSILVGSAIYFMADKSLSEVQSLAQNTRTLAKETLRKAKLEERPYSIFITASEIWVQPESMQSSEDETLAPAQVLTIPEGVTVSLQTNTEDGWLTLKENSQPFVWSFTQSGLCEALDIEFESNKAIQTLAFHPLTAGEVVDDF